MIDIATRKGLFVLDDDLSIRHRAFIGESVTITHRIGDTIYAGLRHGHFGPKLHRSDDGGATFEEITTPALPELTDDAVNTAPDVPWKVDMLWALESDPTGRLWCGTLPGALFHSDDLGASWTLNRSLWERPERAKWFGGGYDVPGIHSICVDPRDASNVRLGISCGGVLQSHDGGASWACNAQGMVAEYMPPGGEHDPDIQDPHLIAQCRAAPDVIWAQHHNGIFRTTDDCASWTRIEATAPSHFGFAVAAHPEDPETAWFVPGVKDECRVPVEGALVVTRTTDGGSTFETLGEGLPQRDAYDIVFRHALAVDSTGRRLMMGSTTGNAWASSDGGDTWVKVSSNLPPIHSVRMSN